MNTEIISNMSVYKFLVKFVISLTSLIIKSIQRFENIHILNKILDLLPDLFFIIMGWYFFCKR